MMVHLATGFLDAAIAYAPATTYLHMFVCPCFVTCYLHFRPQGDGSRQRKAWGFESGPLVQEADMMAASRPWDDTSPVAVCPHALAFKGCGPCFARGKTQICLLYTSDAADE